jgi:hypothetical protein
VTEARSQSWRSRENFGGDRFARLVERKVFFILRVVPIVGDEQLNVSLTVEAA